MTIHELLELGSKNLREARQEEPKALAKRILAFLLKKDVSYLSIHPEEIVETKIETDFNEAIQKKQAGIPLQYITNMQEFMGINFYVDENVLIPRPDTEVLVEEVIKLAKEKENISILDMCTGSGAIAIALAEYLTNAKITASDKSKKALVVAQKNAKNTKASIQFIESDLFGNIKDKFDIIVSNPPYIESDVIKCLDKEVQKEPMMALDGGKDGLDFYRKIAKQARAYLNEDGYLALEIGYNQKEKVKELLKKEGYREIYSKKDFGDNDRIVIGKKVGE